MSARLRHSIASRGLSYNVRWVYIKRSPVAPSQFLVACCLSLPQTDIIGSNRVISALTSRNGGSLPQSCRLLKVIQGILVHAEKFVRLSQTVPGPVVLLVHVCAR